MTSLLTPAEVQAVTWKPNEIGPGSVAFIGDRIVGIVKPVSMDWNTPSEWQWVAYYAPRSTTTCTAATERRAKEAVETELFKER